jgi:hypothetical protein
MGSRIRAGSGGWRRSRSNCVANTDLIAYAM